MVIFQSTENTNKAHGYGYALFIMTAEGFRPE